MARAILIIILCLALNGCAVFHVKTKWIDQAGNVVKVQEIEQVGWWSLADEGFSIKDGDASIERGKVSMEGLTPEQIDAIIKALKTLD